MYVIVIRVVVLNFFMSSSEYRRGAQPQVDWTEEMDTLLWRSHEELGNQWEYITENRFKNKINENQVKNRWYSASFKKFVAENFGADAHRNAKHKKEGVVRVK